MKNKLVKLICAVLAAAMLFCVPASALTEQEMSTNLEKWLVENVSAAQADGKIDSVLDWSVFALARSGCTTLNAEYERYIGKAVSENKNSLYLNDYARIALAALAVGMDARNVGGVDLIEKIENYDCSDEAYTGSVAYALIALNSAKSGNTAAMEKYKSILLAAQRNDGGFNAYLEVNEEMNWTVDGETDSTGIALQAAAPYKDEPRFASLIYSALRFIKASQMDDGGFGSWGSGSAESTAMIIAGLCETGNRISDFTVNGKTPVDALSGYINEDGGGKCWDGSSNVMTSYQMLMGLSAYYRAENGKVGLFDMTCLSPFCSGIEHLAIFEEHTLIGRVVCFIVGFVYRLLGREYVCCRHNGL